MVGGVRTYIIVFIKGFELIRGGVILGRTLHIEEIARALASSQEVRWEWPAQPIHLAQLMRVPVRATASRTWKYETEH